MLVITRGYINSPKKRTEDAIDKKDLTLGCAAPLTGKKACIRGLSPNPNLWWVLRF